MTAADAHYDVFISYSHADADWVCDWLWPRLEAAGLHVCLDRRDFDVGVPSLVNMERAVDHSRHTLLVLTPAWVASEWTAFEQLLTQTEDPAGRRRRLLPLLLQPCQAPRRIAMLTYADFTRREAWDAELPRVIAAVQGKLQLPEVGPRLDQQPRLSPEQHNRQPRAAHTPIRLRRATYHLSIGAILGILLLGGVGWIVLWAPAALPAGSYHILGLSLALLASLFVFCVTRSLGSEAQPRKSPLGMIDAQAIGSLALFIVVLVWWWSPLTPIGIETKTIEKMDEHQQVRPHIGAQVLSNWKRGGYFYPGKIIDVKEGKYLIFYEFSDEEWVEEDNFILGKVPNESELYVNTKVYVQIDQYQNKWAPAIIKNIRSNKYLVAYIHNNDSYHAWVPLQKIVW